MTDKQYLITEEQLALFKKVVGAAEGFHFIADRAMIIEADNMLQSLPMVDSQPVAWFYKDDPYFDGAKWNDKKRLTDSKQLAFWKDSKPEPLYTSPQALTPITADDVSDACVQELWSIGRLTHLGHIGKNDVAACLNAFFKHKSEAK